VENIVLNLYAKFNDDRWWNESSNNNSNVGSDWVPFSGSKKNKLEYVDDDDDDCQGDIAWNSVAATAASSIS